MRLSKVFALFHVIEQQGLVLQDKSIFDYGFGAGTFFRYCPRRSRLFGVELDSVNVEKVKEALGRKGYTRVDLQAIDEERWDEHELLTQQYDLIVASHVLEHLKQPAEVLKRLISCLTPEGFLLGVLPINELVPHQNHEWIVERCLVEDWARAANARIVGYWELDHFTYYALPIFEQRSALGRVAAQGISLALGLAATLVGERLWFRLSALFGRSTGAKPAQAVFLMQPLRV
jgi:SAM-dependent methyltransferase